MPFCPPDARETGYFITEDGSIVVRTGDAEVESAARRYLPDGELNPHWVASTVYWTLEAAQDAQAMAVK